MSQLDDDVTVVITNKPDSELYAVFEDANFDINVGESAKIDVKQAINYIKSGQAEIAETVGDITGEFNDNAVEKTNAFNQNAEDKISAFDLNATNKTNDFNINAVNKTTNFNDNATSKTGIFDSNAVDKTNDFNLNASNKTTDFNNNYLEKKALIDAEVQKAEAYSDEAKQWAIGEPTEPTGYSAKYWANEAASELSGLTSRVSTIEGKIPAEASSSNQLTDKSYVDNMDIDLQRQIDALVVSSDVFDIVGTYAELQAYDISTVPVNDIIKVLVDETHSGAATYYRCVENSDVKSWSYIGSEGAYYTKSEADNRFATPSDIGNATITITQGGVTKGTFTTNQSGNATIDVDAATIPSNMVTTDTAQDISAKKTFLGEKAIYFKQTATTDKLGFTLYTSADAELGALEYRPNTISGNPLLNLNSSQSGNVWLGFRYWSNINIIAPKPSNGNYYIPVNITDGNTTVTAGSNGTVNISSFGYIKGITSSDVTTALGYTPADDSDVVKTTGDQTIAGDKTFTGKLSFNLPCFTAYNGNNTNTPYKKIATIIRTGTNQTCNIPFMFCTTSVSITSGTYNGKIVCRTGSTAGQVQVNSTGIVLNGNPDFISNGDIVFYLLYKNNAPESNQAIFEVWVYVKNTFQGVNIMPLRIGTGAIYEDITVAEWSETSYSVLPSDYTVKNQIIL